MNWTHVGNSYTYISLPGGWLFYTVVLGVARHQSAPQATSLQKKDRGTFLCCLCNKLYYIPLTGEPSEQIVVIPLKFNCGFARVAVRELIQSKHDTPCDKFQKIFSMPTFKLPADYFHESKRKRYKSRFCEYCNRILAGFSKRWCPPNSRVNYLVTFATTKWNKLPEAEKRQHTLSKCDACALLYRDAQEAFQLKPIHNGPSTLEIMYSTAGTSKKDEANTTRMALKVVNTHHTKKFGKNLTESVVELCQEEKLQKKATTAEKRRERRMLLRKV